MNAGQLSAWFEANKKPVLAVAGAGAVGLGLMRARKQKAAAAGGGTPLTPAIDTALATGPAIAGTVPYDSSAYDSYTDLQNQIDQLTAAQQAKAPIPLPYQEGGIYARAGGRSLFQYRDGKIDWLENGTVARQLGASPSTIHYLSKDDDFFKLPSVTPVTR